MPELDFDGLDGVLQLPPNQTQTKKAPAPPVQPPPPVPTEAKELKWPVYTLAALGLVAAVLLGMLVSRNLPGERGQATATRKNTQSAVVTSRPPKTAGAEATGQTGAASATPSATKQVVAPRGAAPREAAGGGAQPSAARAVAPVVVESEPTELPFPARFALNAAAPIGMNRVRFSSLVKGLRGCRGTIQIIGHSCSLGSERIQDAVSLWRAKRVAKLLAREGLPASSMEITARGSREPLAGNDTVAGRAQNRRVSLSCVVEGTTLEEAVNGQ